MRSVTVCLSCTWRLVGGIQTFHFGCKCPPRFRLRGFEHEQGILEAEDRPNHLNDHTFCMWMDMWMYGDMGYI